MTDSSPPSSSPTTGLIVLGNAMYFQPTQENSGVVSATVTEREQMSGSLTSAKVDSLESLHVVMNGSSVDSLYDPDAITTLSPLLKEGAEVSAHVLQADQHASDEAIHSIRMSMVMANLQMESETLGEDGSRILTARKSVSNSNDDGDDEED